MRGRASLSSEYFAAIWAKKACTWICTHASSDIPAVIVGLTRFITSSSIVMLYLHIAFVYLVKAYETIHAGLLPQRPSPQ